MDLIFQTSDLGVAYVVCSSFQLILVLAYLLGFSWDIFPLGFLYSPILSLGILGGILYLLLSMH